MSNLRVVKTKSVFNPEAVGLALTSDPGVARMLTSLAQEIVDEAAATLTRAVPTSVPKGTYDRPKFRGYRWNADPDAVIAQMRVKDESRVFTLRAAFVRKAVWTRVALAISDHPYSLSYEFGANRLPATAFFRHAINVVNSRHSNTTRRYSKASASTP